VSDPFLDCEYCDSQIAVKSEWKFCPAYINMALPVMLHLHKQATSTPCINVKSAVACSFR
jgi:hypothetical protein